MSLSVTISAAIKTSYVVRIIALLLGLALTAPAHSDTPGTPDPDAPPVVIGAIYNTSGQQHVLDAPSANGARLAARQLNAGGGVLRRPLELIVVDGQSDVPVVAEKTRDLLDAHPAIV